MTGTLLPAFYDDRMRRRALEMLSDQMPLVVVDPIESGHDAALRAGS